MLIDFTVENYRSIKDPVTLSAVAAPGRAPRARKSDSAQSTARSRRVVSDAEIAQTYLVPGAGFELLPALGIFGANASGKSNVLRALDELVFISSTVNPLAPSMLPIISPFRLSKETAHAPTRFELRVEYSGDIYIYVLSFDTNRVFEESMKYIPASSKKFQNRLLFERVWNADSRSYVWKNGTDFTNAYSEIQNNLAPHVPFAGFLGGTLRHPKFASWQRWLATRVPGHSLMNEQSYQEVAVNSMTSFPQSRRDIKDFIQQFDTAISDLEIEGVATENIKPSILVTHDTLDGPVKWALQEESQGTQRLLVLAHKIIVSLKNGAMLLEDELGSNIHPNVTRKIIKLFQCEKTNPNHAQLIFTSHDNTLQRHNLLRRDQIWFTEKRKDGSTNLYPLTDFKPRNDLALDQAYLDGRYGAVPILPALENILPQNGHATTASESVH